MKIVRNLAIVGAVLMAAGGSVVAVGSLRGDGDGHGVFASSKKAQLGVLKAAEAGLVTDEAGVRPVPAARVTVEERPRTVRLTGNLVADEQSDVASNVSGIVQEVFVERGSLVEKGAVLVQLDPTDARNRLAEGEAAVQELRVRLGLDQGASKFDPEAQPEVRMAKAALDLAVLTRDRYARMQEQGVVAKDLSDRAETEWRSAQERYQQGRYQARQLHQSYLTARTRLEALRKAVDDTAIRAPFTGWVVERGVSVGEGVSPGGGDKRVATLVKVDPLRLALTVPQQDSGLVAPGQVVEFEVDSLPGRTFTGEVRYVAPAVERNSRALTVEAVVANPDGLLRPGLFATASLVLPETAPRVTVPEAALVREGDVALVYVVRDGVARRQVAGVGPVAEGRAEVLTGLAEGDVVLTEPAGIEDGAKVDPCIS